MSNDWDFKVLNAGYCALDFLVLCDQPAHPFTNIAESPSPHPHKHIYFNTVSEHKDIYIFYVFTVKHYNPWQWTITCYINIDYGINLNRNGQNIHFIYLYIRSFVQTTNVASVIHKIIFALGKHKIKSRLTWTILWKTFCILFEASNIKYHIVGAL